MLLRDADGTPVSWQGFLLDVTERNEAEERLRIAEERYRTIVEHTPVITYQEAPVVGEYVPETTFPYVSPQVESLLGYDHDAWVSTPGLWAQVTHPDDLPAVLAESQRTNETGEHYRQDYRVFAADGRTVWFHDEAHLIRDGEGLPLVVAGRHGGHHRAEGGRRALPPRPGAPRRPSWSICRRSSTPSHRMPTPPSSTCRPRWSRSSATPRRNGPGRTTSGSTTCIPRIARPWRPADRASASSHAQYQLDYRFRCADGSYIWVHDEARLGPDLGRRRLLAGVPVRRDRAEGRGSAAGRRREDVPRDGRAPPGGRLSGGAGRQRRGLLHRAPGRDRVRLLARGMAGDTGVLARPSASGRPRAGHRGEPPRQRVARDVLGGVPVPARRRDLRVDPRRRDVRRRSRRRGLVAGLHARHHRAQGGRAAAPGSGGDVPHHRRAQPRGDLHAGVRPQRSWCLTHHVHLPATARDARVLGGRGPGGWDALDEVPPPGRPRACALGRRGQQQRRGGELLARVPHDPQGRADRVGAGRRPAGGDRGAPRLLAGVHDGHHRAQAGRRATGARARGGTRSHGPAPGARRHEEHVPASRLARPAHAARRDPRSRDHARTGRRPPPRGRRPRPGPQDPRGTPGGSSAS